MSSLQDPEVQCPSCGNLNVWFAEICVSCGTSLAGVTLHGGDAPTRQGEGVQSGNTQLPCPSCRAMNGLVDRFCTSCGTSLGGALQGGDAPTRQGEVVQSGNTQTAASLPSQPTIICTSCGTAVDSSVRFCTRCGTPIGPSVARQRPQGGFSCPYCSSSNPPITKKSFSVIFWIVLIVLLILDFLLAPFAFLIGKDERLVCSGCGIKLG
jgi:predicted amidophosphoribosyltransferase